MPTKIRLTENQARALARLERLSPRFKDGWVPRKYLVGPGALEALARKGLAESRPGSRGGRGGFYRRTREVET